MNTRKLIVLAILLLMAVAIISSIITGTSAPTPPQETSAVTTGAAELELDAQAVYSQAAEVLQSASELMVSSVSTLKTTIANETYTVDTNRIFRANDIGSDSMRALVNESVTIGEHTVAYTEGYSNNIGYISMENNHFQTEMTSDVFLQRQFPAIALDASLYSDITLQHSGEKLIVTFNQASACETWAVPEGAQLISATGTAVLNRAYELEESTYSVSYGLGNALFEKTVTSGIVSTVPSFSIPGENASCTISAPDAILALEIACGYLLQADSVVSSISENIICQAYSDHRLQEAYIDMFAEGTNCAATIDITTTLTNSGKADSSTVKTQNITYQDSQYMLTVNNGEPTQQTGITPYMMKTYCQDYYLSTLILPEYIVAATVTDEGSTYRYEYTANEDFAHLLCQNTSQILYQDPTLLITLFGSYNVDTVNAYLQVDKTTGLPISSGISCTVSHTIEGFPYLLQYQTQQAYSIGNK